MNAIVSACVGPVAAAIAVLVQGALQANGGEPVSPMAQATPPNILLFFSDDHAQKAISAYGGNLNQTPNIDSIAKNGVRFANSFCTNSICSPSRATLMTGQYAHINGVPAFNCFDGQRDNVAKQLQKGGYHTGVIGKWHLGSDPTGFDRWIVLPGGGFYWNPEFIIANNKLSIKGHCTEITTDLGIEWLKTRPKDKPFFLMLNQKAPHRNWDPAKRHVEMFKDNVYPEPETLWDNYATRPTALGINEQTIAKDLVRYDLKLSSPFGLNESDSIKWQWSKPMELEIDGKLLTGKELVKYKYQKYMRDYMACVQGVDEGVGKVLDYLDQNGLSENTIVIYSADNGWFLGELGLYDKRFMYEPGLRVPLLAKGPGIQPATVIDQMVLNIDLAPTFLDLAGLSISKDMQGRSLAPLLRGERPKDWRKSMYYRYYHDPGHHNTAAHLGVRTETHKLIYYWKKDVYELFDLNKDPQEQMNLLYNEQEAMKPEIADKFMELKAEIIRLQKEFRDDGRYSDPTTWPAGSADNGPFDDYKSIGYKSVEEAISASGSHVFK
jgi:arylsulfatase A-like enzyme